MRALPTRLCAALFINWRSRGFGSSCRALAGRPARRHAATEPTGTVAPQPRQPGGTIGTRLPVGLAETRGTQMSPWRPLGCGGRQHVGMSGVSLCPLRWHSTPTCLLPLQPALTSPSCLLPPQPSYCHSNLLLSQPPSCHPTSLLPPQPPSCHPNLPAVTPACSCLCVTSLQMELGDGSKGVSPCQARATAPCTGSRMWPQHFLPPRALLATANRFSLSFAESTHLLPPYESHLQADGEKEGGGRKAELGLLIFHY